MVKMNLAKKCLEMSAEIADVKDDYMESCVQFGKCLKLGTHKNSINAELLRFNVSKTGMSSST